MSLWSDLRTRLRSILVMEEASDRSGAAVANTA